MESCAIYGLETQGRALCSQSGDQEVVRFYVGTLSPRAEGQVHQLDFSDETNQISRKIFKLNVGEVWQVQSCPWAHNLLAICYNDIKESSVQMKSGVWRIPDSPSPTSDLPPTHHHHQNQDLLQSWKFSDYHPPSFTDPCQTIDWHPSRIGRLCTIHSSQFFLWDLDASSLPKLVSSSTPSSSPSSSIYTGKWSPHLDGNQLAYVTMTSVTGCDTRSMKTSWTLPLAHKFQVRDLDFNPNRQYFMATCGDDCAVRFWDVRNPQEPLKEIKAHSHWVWRVRYNAFHDQLLLTAGSDSRVILHSLPTISSEASKGNQRVFTGGDGGGPDLEGDQGEEIIPSPPLQEGILSKYEEHEDAVYAVEWSTFDPWTFASLSYDGRLVINRVPKSFKYKILL